MDFTSLKNAPRALLEADLAPVAGPRFQPTGFADLGAAEYKLPCGTPMLLVESAQSVANRLEKTCLDGDGPGLDPALDGLSYIVADLEGAGNATATSSLVEAHRIGSPYFLLNKNFQNKLIEEMGYDAKLPLDWKKIYATLFKYDANALVHGVFLSLLEGGRVRAPRAITGFIEAEEVERVLSGGVKNSPMDPTGSTQVDDVKPVDAERAKKGGVYSNVPYSRVEYVAEKITAYFNLDFALIRGYRLGDEAAGLLIALALLKVRRFLDTSLRLRTACDFQVKSITTKAPPNFVLPSEPELLSDVQAGIRACAPLFAKPAVTRLKTKVKVVEKEKAEKAATGKK
jgi:CRISPR-associated protein Csb1